MTVTVADTWVPKAPEPEPAEIELPFLYRVTKYVGADAVDVEFGEFFADWDDEEFARVIAAAGREIRATGARLADEQWEREGAE